VLAGADVVIIADRDEPGRSHAADVAASLGGKASSVRVVEAATGKDASDHLAAGHGLGDFREAEIRTAGADLDDDLAVIAAGYTPVDWAAAWKAQPEDVEWLIEPILESGTLNALFAKTATGKSLIALEWSLRLVREGRTVVYVDDESRIADVVDRLQAMGAEPGELGRLLLYSFAGLPPLDTPPGGAHLLALAVTAGAELVVLDTTTRFIKGAENDSDTWLQLYRCSLVPLKSRGITVLRLDHPGKDESRGQRGSSAKDGDVDTIWRMVTVVKGLKYKLVREKSRSGHGEADELAVDRKYIPVRHEWTCPDRSRENSVVGQVCGQLDKLGIPPSAGRDRCRTALNEVGVAISNALLSDVVRQRRFAPDSYGTAGQLGDAADNCPHPPHPLGVGGGTGGRHPAADWPENSEGMEANP
jgi:hypothetical protein